MTTPVWINLILAVPFVLAFVGIPLWMTWKRTDTAPDFSESRAYLAATASQRTVPATIRPRQPSRPRTLADLLATSSASGRSADHSELALSQR